jgi:FkbM family methyltransferase
MFKQLISRLIAPAAPSPEARMIGLYSRFLRPGDLCFDIGANMGNRLRIFQRMGCRVVALEPQQPCDQALREEFGADPEVVLIQKAAAASETEMEMLIANAHTISSLSTEWIRKVKESGRFKDYRWDKTEKVVSTTLDALIASHGVPRFIKIDVEGYEPEVLRGLTQPAPFLSFEWTPEFSSATVESLAHLGTIGAIETNYSLGESMELASDQWMRASRLLELLKPMETDARVFGDIYIRFPTLL